MNLEGEDEEEGFEDGISLGGDESDDIEACSRGSDDDGDDEDDDDDEEDEEEPKLKFERIGNDLTSILDKDAVSCVAVHSKVFLHK